MDERLRKKYFCVNCEEPLFTEGLIKSNQRYCNNCGTKIDNVWFSEASWIPPLKVKIVFKEENKNNSNTVKTEIEK